MKERYNADRLTREAFKVNFIFKIQWSSCLATRRQEKQGKCLRPGASLNHCNGKRAKSTSEADEVLVSEESVDAGVGLTAGSHESSEGDGLLLAGDLAGLVNLSDVDLDGGVVLGSDESVSGGALSGNVKVNNLLLVVLHLDEGSIGFRLI